MWGEKIMIWMKKTRSEKKSVKDEFDTTAQQLDLKWEDLIAFKVADFVEMKETNNEDFQVNRIEEIEVVAFNKI